jgi:hypothetical protein
VKVTDVFKAQPNSINANTTYRDLTANMTVTVWMNQSCPSGSIGANAALFCVSHAVVLGSIGTEALIMAGQDSRWQRFGWRCSVDLVCSTQISGRCCQFLHGRRQHDVEPPEHL